MLINKMEMVNNITIELTGKGTRKWKNNYEDYIWII
jgi:hypothetical protein